MHEYDTDYKYHTTLFSDKDESKVFKCYNLIAKEPIPDILKANTILIGVSESGNLGTFKINHIVKLK